MSEDKPDKIGFRMLDYSTVGGDTVTFKLEDGTLVKVKVGIERVGVATNYRSPDGSPYYAQNTSVQLSAIPHDKRFTLSKSQIKVQLQQQQDDSSKRSPPSHFA